MIERWCAKHRDGWCAVKNGKKPVEGADNVPTKCGHVVVLPGGYERREPDCPECRQALGEQT